MNTIIETGLTILLLIPFFIMFLSMSLEMLEGSEIGRAILRRISADILEEEVYKEDKYVKSRRHRYVIR